MDNLGPLKQLFLKIVFHLQNERLEKHAKDCFPIENKLSLKKIFDLFSVVFTFFRQIRVCINFFFLSQARVTDTYQKGCLKK